MRFIRRRVQHVLLGSALSLRSAATEHKSGILIQAHCSLTMRCDCVFVPVFVCVICCRPGG